MEANTATLVAIISAVIAALALLWGIYAHISTRKIAKLTYDVSQLSDFGVPESFLADMPKAPMAITVTSRGNKGTENIILRLKTVSPIEDFEASPANLPITHNDNELTIESARLNPSQKIKLFVRCAGNPNSNQIDELDISHSEGVATDEKEIQTISFSFAGIEMEYNTSELKAQISRIGPISFK